MKTLPLISIVTPSFNQAEFIGETLQSLVDQDYPNLEVIIQDGGSSDGSVAVAQQYVDRYPSIFRLFVEKDRGQAHALNLGFARTSGEIMGFLNSDDTLYPGCLHSVAREIDPTADRLIVFGRCLFTGEDSPYVGVEHPAEYKSHFDQLAIWTRGYNTVPQPSTFWHRRVWETCGGLHEAETHVLDYDLFCRFSARFRFHRVDELWATYRMHSVSKSAQRTEAEVLEMSIAASRRHWPPAWHPLSWRLAASYRAYERHGHERARHYARQAERARAEGRTLEATAAMARTFMYSPAMAWQRLLQPVLLGHGLTWLERVAWSSEEVGGEFAGRYEDSWIGPVYRQRVRVPRDARRLRVKLQHSPPGDDRHAKITAELFLNGRKQATQEVTVAGPFEFKVDLKRFRNKDCRLELRISPFFVPSDTGGPDTRKLTAQLGTVKVS